MTINYYRMREDQEEQVVNLIYALMSEYGAEFKSNLTQKNLRQHLNLVNFEVAEEDGRIIGFCSWVMSFSTWRCMKGLHINDLAVTTKYNSREVGRRLLQLAAKTAALEGANFVRNEVDVTTDQNEALYQELGFWAQKRHEIHFLEPDKFTLLIKDDSAI